jgi:hypothetical protein
MTFIDRLELDHVSFLFDAGLVDNIGKFVLKTVQQVSYVEFLYAFNIFDKVSTVSILSVCSILFMQTIERNSKFFAVEGL